MKETLEQKRYREFIRFLKEEKEYYSFLETYYSEKSIRWRINSRNNNRYIDVIAKAFPWEQMKWSEIDNKWRRYLVNKRRNLAIIFNLRKFLS